MTVKDRLRALLYRSESTLKVDVRYILRGGFWTLLRFLAGLGASIASMVAFGNLLPRENYGTYSYLLSLASSLGFLTLSGMGPGVVRAVAQGKESLLPFALKLQLRYNLLATATISAAGLYYWAHGNALFGASLALLAFVIPLESAFHIYEHVLIGRKRFDTLALLTSFSALGAAAATVLTLFFTDSVRVLVEVYAAASLLPSFIAYKLVVRRIPKTRPAAEEMKDLSRTAFHITGAGVIGTLAQYIDKIILFQAAGPAALAVYGFATAGPERLKGLVKNWVGISLPRLSERSVTEIRQNFYKRLMVSTILGAGLALAYILIAPFVFGLFLPKYLDSVRYSQVYALGLVFVPSLIYIGSIFYSQNMLRAIYITGTGNQIVRIMLFFIFGWLWQTWGLVFAFLGSQLISLILNIVVWERLSRFNNETNLANK